MLNFESFFPILTIDNDMIISKSGDISLVYKVELPEVFSLDQSSLDSISETISNGLENLSTGTIFQKQDYFLKNNNKSLVTNSTGYLPKSDNRLFYECPIMEHQCYITLTTRVSSKLNRKTHCKETIVKDFIRDSESFINKLNLSSFFKIQQLKEEEIVTLLNLYFSLSDSSYPSENYEISFDNGFRVRENFAKVLSINKCADLSQNLSRSVRESALSSDCTDFFVPFTHNYVFSPSCNHLYNQVIFIEDSEELKKEIERKSNNFKAVRNFSRFNNLAFEEIDNFLDHGEKNQIKYVKANFSMFVWDSDFRILEKNIDLVRKEFYKSGLRFNNLGLSTKNFYQSNCPGNCSSIDKIHFFPIPIKTVSVLINLETSLSKSTNGILFCDTLNDEPIMVDLWDSPLKRGLIVNRNRLVFGPSGTGKSFLINHIVSQYHEQGNHVVIMDIGNSYKKLCFLVGGEYLEYDNNNPLKFNPFNIDKLSIEKKEFLISLLTFLWKGPNGKSIREEKNVLSKYLDSFYEKVDNDTKYPCFNSFYEHVSETDIESAEKFFNKNSFLFSTSDFYKKGDYDYILNSNDKMDFLQKRFIVFELDNVKDHPILFPLIIMLLIETIMDKIRNLTNVKKSIFIDECWKPLSQGEMVGFIKYLYKTIRKFYGEIAIATQDIEDIISTDAGPAMINNTDTFLLLSHKKKLSLKNKFPKYLSFTESDVSKLYSTEKRQVFIKMGNSSNVYNLKVSPERYSCYTSNGDENSKIFKTYRETKNMKVSLDNFVETMNES